MNTTVSVITVLFQDPFWIALYEREYCGSYEVCKITFGAEPKDNEVYNFLLKNHDYLKFTSSEIAQTTAHTSRINPKRMQRLVHKQISSSGIGTKAQQALSKQHEDNKAERKLHNKDIREQRNEQMFELKQQKRKEKHKGH